MIKYKLNTEINKQKWDAVIATAALPLIYAESWYLDIVNPGWGGLVLNDYEAVMPLPVQKKFGIHYLAQPYFTQQLGIFGNKPSDDSFINSIPDKFKYIDISLNTANIIDQNIGQQDRSINQELKLNSNYIQLQKKYSSNHQRNIKKGQKNNLHIKKGIAPEIHLKLMLDHLPPKLSAFVKDYKRVQLELMTTAIAKNKGFIVGVLDENGNLCGSVLFLDSFNRLIYLLSVTTDKGKSMSAMHFLIDEIIKENAGSGKILDFEGSNIPPVHKFYKGFGAEEKKYIQLKINKLPWPLNWIKK